MGGPLTPGRARRLEEPLVVAAAAAVVLLAVLPPLLAVARELVGAEGVRRLLCDARLWWLLLRSLGLGATVTLVALALGVPLGLLFARATLPFRKALFAAHVAVVFLPPFLPALGWFHCFGREGLVGNDFSSRLLFSDFGAVCVLAACFTPIVTALTALGVSSVDASLEEAGRIAGGRWLTALLILVPCAAPVIALAGIIVFSLALSELGVPMFLRVDVYPALVFSRLGGMNFAPGEAAVFVIPLVLVTLVLLTIERRFAGRRAIAALANHRARREPLFPFRWSLFVTVLVAASGSLAPIALLVIHAATRGGFSEVTNWLGDAPYNGLRASAAAALVMTAVALVLGRALARRTRAGLWLDGLLSVAFMLPASVLGVGLALAWNHRATNWLYASYGLLVVGFVARYSVVATRTFASAVAQVPASLEDAARTVGAGYLRRLSLLARLVPRGLVGALLLAWVFGLRDLETAAFFYPPGGEPLTVRLLTLEANGPPAVVAALSVVHVGITFAVMALALLLLRNGRRA